MINIEKLNLESIKKSFDFKGTEKNTIDTLSKRKKEISSSRVLSKVRSLRNIRKKYEHVFDSQEDNLMEISTQKNSSWKEKGKERVNYNISESFVDAEIVSNISNNAINNPITIVDSEQTNRTNDFELMTHITASELSNSNEKFNNLQQKHQQTTVEENIDIMSCLDTDDTMFESCLDMENYL